MRGGLRLAGLAVLAAATACGELQDNAYPTVQAAKLDGAFGRGWLPHRLPRSARSIRERHRRDDGRGMVSARFDPTEDMDLAGCRQVGPWEMDAPPYPADWWPKDVPPSSISRHRHAYYACREGAYLAVSRGDGEWFYWRP